jgi:hypothetical protein
MTSAPAPDNTAVRVALWRALHVAADAPPHVFTDELGLALAEASTGPPDMSAFAAVPRRDRGAGPPSRGRRRAVAPA